MSGAPTRDRFRLLALVGILVVAAATALLPMLGAPEVEVDRERIAAADLTYGEALATSDADPAAARAKFAAAAEAFALADPSRRSAGAISNEANARLQAGEIGAAIAGYRLALSLDPGNARIEANLAEARRKVNGSIGLPEPTIVERVARLWTGVSEQTRWAAAIALLWAAVILRTLSRRAFPAVLTALALFALVGATVVIDLVGRCARETATASSPPSWRRSAPAWSAR